MLAHDFNKRLKFERRDPHGNDGAGNTLQTWRPVCTVAASCLPRKLQRREPETVLAGRLAGTALYTIILRQGSLTNAIDTDCRATDLTTGEVFNVMSVLDLDGSRRFWTLDAQKGTAN